MGFPERDREFAHERKSQKRTQTLFQAQACVRATRDGMKRVLILRIPNLRKNCWSLIAAGNRIFFGTGMMVSASKLCFAIRVIRLFLKSAREFRKQRIVNEVESPTEAYFSLTFSFNLL